MPTRAGCDLRLLSWPRGIFGDRELQRAGAGLETTGEAGGRAQSSAAGSHRDSHFPLHPTPCSRARAHCCTVLWDPPGLAPERELQKSEDAEDDPLQALMAQPQQEPRHPQPIRMAKPTFPTASPPSLLGEPTRFWKYSGKH